MIASVLTSNLCCTTSSFTARGRINYPDMRMTQTPGAFYQSEIFPGIVEGCEEHGLTE